MAVPQTILETDLEGLELLNRGKVRDIYALDSHLLTGSGLRQWDGASAQAHQVRHRRATTPNLIRRPVCALCRPQSLLWLLLAPAPARPTMSLGPVPQEIRTKVAIV